MTLVVRTDGDAASFSDTLRTVVAEVEPDLPITGVKTMDEVVSSSLDTRRFSMLLLGIFASIAMMMAAVGLYGVMSFSVAQRTHEIGIRRALGAQPADLIRQVMGEGFRLVALGLGIGILGALGLTRTIMALIHGVSATDLPSYVLGVMLLASVGLLASYLPARRAIQVEPMRVLRAE
jgi:putative ABC transport system permease protein